jgi:hypothetical protein
MRIFFGVLAVIGLCCMIYTFVMSIMDIKKRLSSVG